VNAALKSALAGAALGLVVGGIVVLVMWSGVLW
jgi:hypothetical protein